MSVNLSERPGIVRNRLVPWTLPSAQVPDPARHDTGSTRAAQHPDHVNVAHQEKSVSAVGKTLNRHQAEADGRRSKFADLCFVCKLLSCSGYNTRAQSRRSANASRAGGSESLANSDGVTASSCMDASMSMADIGSYRGHHHICADT